ncbi:MAG: hypothetical protein OEV81_07970 [Betaproteobacteria bacterium]|nr:hypothetical protein [Betaproteobacteria bacterium]MDH5222103.1 hypothetical protein [Betaproteobacteria bacterium]MDH5352031.1 hypothetical protein [Betaproteobacteria bacterium]
MAGPAYRKPNVAAWRIQEQELVERWRAANERLRVAHAGLAGGAGAPDEALQREADAARTEIESLRRQVARLKREFLSGKRY